MSIVGLRFLKRGRRAPLPACYECWRAVAARARPHVHVSQLPGRDNRPVTSRHYVFLDPDGTLGDGWLYVLVQAGTGVIYRHQYGGSACRQGEIEGYLVPVAAEDVLGELRNIFERTLRGAGTWDSGWPEQHVSVIRQAVGRIPFWVSDGTTDERYSLSFDESRLAEADEAWLPVLTPSGPGVLVWRNSD